MLTRRRVIFGLAVYVACCALAYVGGCVMSALISREMTTFTSMTNRQAYALDVQRWPYAVRVEAWRLRRSTATFELEDYDPAIERLFAEYTLPEDESKMITVHAAGWPMWAVSGATIVHRDEVAKRRRKELQQVATVARSNGYDEYAYGPRWWGILINGALYAVVVGTVLWALVKARASVRRARGQCVKCGYAVTSGRCPECGAQSGGRATV